MKRYGRTIRIPLIRPIDILKGYSKEAAKEPVPDFEYVEMDYDEYMHNQRRKNLRKGGS